MDQPPPADDPMARKLKIIQRDVFAIALSSKDPCTAYKIAMEYDDLNGDEIDYKQFGFYGLEQFLRACPTLEETLNADGKVAFMAKKGVGSEATQDVHRLVSGQKKKQKRKGKGNRGARRGGGASRGGASRGGHYQQQPFQRAQFQSRSMRGSSAPARGFGFQGRQSMREPSRDQGVPQFGVPQFGRMDPSRLSFNGTLSVSVNKGQRNVGWGGPTGGGFVSPVEQTASKMPGKAQQLQLKQPQQRQSNMHKGSVSEGRARLMAALGECRGNATLHQLNRKYAQEHGTQFNGIELERHFGTRDIRAIVERHFADELKLDYEDCVLMFMWIAATPLVKRRSSVGQAAELPTGAEKWKMPTIVQCYDKVVEMLVRKFPLSIALSEMSKAYEEAFGIALDPLTVYRKSWQELVEKTFSAKLRVVNGTGGEKRVGLQQSVVDARGLKSGDSATLRAIAVTPAELGIQYDESDSEDDEEDEEEGEDGESEYESAKENASSKTGGKQVAVEGEEHDDDISSLGDISNASIGTAPSVASARRAPPAPRPPPANPFSHPRPLRPAAAPAPTPSTRVVPAGSVFAQRGSVFNRPEQAAATAAVPVPVFGGRSPALPSAAAAPAAPPAPAVPMPRQAVPRPPASLFSPSRSSLWHPGKLNDLPTEEVLKGTAENPLKKQSFFNKVGNMFNKNKKSGNNEVNKVDESGDAGASGFERNAFNRASNTRYSFNRGTRPGVAQSTIGFGRTEQAANMADVTAELQQMSIARTRKMPPPGLSAPNAGHPPPGLNFHRDPPKGL